MKKHLFTAVLAIVAVGGVFAMQADKNLLQTGYEQIGDECTLVTDVPNDCSTSGTIACSSTRDLFFYNPANPEPCQIPLVKNP